MTGIDGAVAGDDADIIGWWRLLADGRDDSPHARHASILGAVDFGPSIDSRIGRPVARLAGEGYLEVAGAMVGLQDFTLSAWINVPAATRTTIGDIAAAFDPVERRGFSLGVHHSSPCGNHGNDRNLYFGFDWSSDVHWTARGRPSPSTIMVCALAVHDGVLFAGTWEAGASNVGRVYRLDGDGWIDCGVPSDANAVTRLAVHDGRLFAGSSRLRGGGSGMPDSPNTAAGGQVRRYEGGGKWSDSGQLDGADSIAGLVPFDGDLYAIPMYSEGVFRLSSSRSWMSCGTPGRRLLALGVHAGSLYGAGNDHADVDSAIAQTAAGIVVPQRAAEGGGGVFRYEGDGWTSLGLQRDTTQVYSIETYGGQMYIGTWPNGIVYRRGDAESWERSGTLGGETEVMNLLAFNGKLYAGTLPGAQVRRFDDADVWTLIGTLDETPDVRYRRAASMAVYQGELFCGTLPSGTVHSMRAGLVLTDDHALSAGWRHVAAVRNGRRSELYVDGRMVASKSEAETLEAGAPSTWTTLMLGGGPRSGLEGELAEVRLRRSAMPEADVVAEAARKLW
jgi:concanavalin A-like lectin/glucanase superfamily protein